MTHPRVSTMDREAGVGPKDAALRSVTEATREAVEANRELFRALQRRAERRRDAMAAGASVAEIQAAIRAGHEEREPTMSDASWLAVDIARVLRRLTQRKVTEDIGGREPASEEEERVAAEYVEEDEQ